MPMTAEPHTIDRPAPRPEPHAAPLRMPFDLVQILADVHEILSVPASEREVGLLFDLPDRMPAELIGNPAELRGALLQLVGCALRLSRAGEVRVRVQDDEPTRLPRRLRFSVYASAPACAEPEQNRSAVASSVPVDRFRFTAEFQFPSDLPPP